MKPPSPAELMQLVDGELPAARAREVTAWLAEPEGRQAALQVDGIRQVGDVVRARAHGAGASFDVVDDVMARLDAPAPGHLRPVPGEGRGADQRHAPVWVSLGAAALAAAAVVALLVGRPGNTPSESPQAAAPTSTPADTASATPEVPESEAVGASIERLDPGSNGASLFVVQAGAVSTPVVWLLDDRDETGDRMGPL